MAGVSHVDVKEAWSPAARLSSDGGGEGSEAPPMVPVMGEVRGQASVVGGG